MRPVRAISTILRATSSAREIVDPEGDLDLGEEGERVFGVGVGVEVALLLAHALHFGDADGFERSTAKRFEDFLDEEGLHDGDDLFHDGAVRGQ